MYTGIKIFITLAALRSLFSISSATVASATYFEHFTSTACFGDEDQGPNVVAVSQEIFNSKDLCGQQMEVMCIGGAKANACKNQNKIKVKIVNVCPPTICPGNMDICLSKQAFTQIADINAETIRVDFN